MTEILQSEVPDRLDRKIGPTTRISEFVRTPLTDEVEPNLVGQPPKTKSKNCVYTYIPCSVPLCSTR